MRKARIAIPLLVIGALVSAYVVSCSVLSREYFTQAPVELGPRIDEYLERLREARAIPGIAAAVVKDGEVIYVGAHGVRNLDTNEDLRSDDVFHTASVSKTFVATAILQLVEEGDVSLDAPVTRYLSYFRLADDRAADITIAHLLTHTSGLPDVEDYDWDEPEDDDGALERYVRSLTAVELIGAPGESWSYSNMGYEILGDVLSKVSGRTFEEQIESRLLEPLGMTASTFLPDAVPRGDRVTPHRGSIGPRPIALYSNRAHAPSSTLQSNVHDLALWVTAHLRRGSLDAVRVLGDASCERMWEERAKVDGPARMGLGWFIVDHRWSRFIAHAGRDPGFFSFVGFLPEKNVGVVVLSNYDGMSSMDGLEIAREILDIGLGRSPAPPVVSIAVPIGRVAEERGIDAAIEEYRSLESKGRDAYKFGPGELMYVGNELYAQGRYDEAIRIFELEDAEFPRFGYMHLMMARCYRNKGDLPRARIHYEECLERQPSLADEDLERDLTEAGGG